LGEAELVDFGWGGDEGNGGRGRMLDEGLRGAVWAGGFVIVGGVVGACVLWAVIFWFEGLWLMARVSLAELEEAEHVSRYLGTDVELHLL